MATDEQEMLEILARIKNFRVFEILPIRRNVEHRSALDTLYYCRRSQKVLEVQTFYKNDQQVVIDAEKFIIRQPPDSMI